MRLSRRAGFYLAFLAIALQALWPLLAQARPKNAVLVPVCTVEGVTHYVEVPGGQTPVEERTSKHSSHCDFCFFGADKTVASVHLHGVLPSGAQLQVPVHEESVPSRLDIATAARPRAPPFSRSVDMNHDETRRNHEEAFAFLHRGDRAGDADFRHRLVRRGVLRA